MNARDASEVPLTDPSEQLDVTGGEEEILRTDHLFLVGYLVGGHVTSW